MVKFLMIFLLFMFILNKISLKLCQMYYQNLFFLVFIGLLFNFPLNNLLMWLMIYNNLMLDFYSWGLIMLTLWIFSLIMIYSINILNSNLKNLYLLMMNIMMILLVLCFSTNNLMLFYIYFESSLIPIFMLILGWGFQVERMQAGFYMMLYTMFGSMPLFVIINWLYKMNFSMNMNFMFISLLNFYIYLALMSAFLIKLPMYMFHLWLPKAHVEAPIMGSMILAGVMLKLGGYGILRVMFMMMEMSIFFNKFILIFSLLGGFLSSLICLCQVDMKMLVAYSSVVHMSILLSGLMTMFNWGVLGGFLMMLSHGLCSSGLFCLVNLNYERILSRSLYINKGLINYFPSMSLMWFLLCSSSISFPPSLSLFSEIFLFNSLIMWSKLMVLILLFLSFFSAFYIIYMYTFSQHGKVNIIMMSYMFSVLDYLILMLHWIPLNLLFLVLFIFI